jgi:hypothetical protein
MNTYTKVALIGVCGLSLLAATPAFLQDPQDPQDKAQDKAKRAKVLKLMEMTGAAKMGKEIMDQMMAQFDRMPGLPEGFVKKFSELAKPEDLVKLVVPIYMKHVTEKDLDAVIAFFSTDAGKRWLAVQPKIVKESMAAGQKWGRELGRRTVLELQKDR